MLVGEPGLHLPLGKPVKLLLRSKDVLHNFAVPQFRVKMDLVPGWSPMSGSRPRVPGSFDLLCEELCGIAHFAMRGQVVVEEERRVPGVAGRHPTFAQPAAQTRRRCRRRPAALCACAAPAMARKAKAILR